MLIEDESNSPLMWRRNQNTAGRTGKKEVAEFIEHCPIFASCHPRRELTFSPT
jgi:hypothetical protein